MHGETIKFNFDPILHRGTPSPLQLDLRYLQDRLESQNSQIKTQEAIKCRKHQNFCNKLMFSQLFVGELLKLSYFSTAVIECRS